MPIDTPLGLRGDSIVLFPLTVGGFLILATEVVDHLEAGLRSEYWRGMAEQLRRLGLPYDDVANAWRAFAD